MTEEHLKNIREHKVSEIYTSFSYDIFSGAWMLPKFICVLNQLCSQFSVVHCEMAQVSSKHLLSNLSLQYRPFVAHVLL